MTLKECYELIGADYNDVIIRLGGEDRVLRFIPKLIADSSFNDLIKAFADEDWEAAFRASHTMKGNYANFGLTKLQTSSSELCEMLRPCVFNPEAAAQLEIVKKDYADAMDALSKLG
ncbi:MAG: Hpt domain-containing protein [Clostridia bacterium]|nr:Hpt domain-containing protein [Clostridia bacterium]MBR5976299.1 Hpt domain-containing protein [Clostridia bacterium]MBR6479343.1 Hpt domain-containing protein [Clostridia bacterium]